MLSPVLIFNPPYSPPRKHCYYLGFTREKLRHGKVMGLAKGNQGSERWGWNTDPGLPLKH